MKDKYSRQEITELFEKAKTPEDVRKMKRKAMHSKVKLGELRKRFCKKCYNLLDNSKVRIKKDFKIVRCKCGYVARWKIK